MWRPASRLSWRPLRPRRGSDDRAGATSCRAHPARPCGDRVPAQTATPRSEFLHHLTTQLVRAHDGLCLEDLRGTGRAKTTRATASPRAAWGAFRRHLEYQTVWNRRPLAVTDRVFPASKICPVCGAGHETPPWADRIGTYGLCGSVHPRDCHAAWNIRAERLELLAVAAGHAQTLHDILPGKKSPPATPIVLRRFSRELGTIEKPSDARRDREAYPAGPNSWCVRARDP